MCSDFAKICLHLFFKKMATVYWYLETRLLAPPNTTGRLSLQTLIHLANPNPFFVQAQEVKNFSCNAKNHNIHELQCLCSQMTNEKVISFSPGFVLIAPLQVTSSLWTAVTLGLLLAECYTTIIDYFILQLHIMQAYGLEPSQLIEEWGKKKRN